jgi:hypothetical protein
MLGKVMEGYRPDLPAVDDPDLLRCMTDEAFSYDGELAGLDKAMARQVRDAQAEVEATKKEFYLRVYPPQFRIDHEWKSRPGLAAKHVYGCWDGTGYWDATSRHECTRDPGSVWRVRSTKWVESPEVNLYSGTATPKQPELMSRMDQRGLKTPERLHCMVNEVVHPKDSKYACYLRYYSEWDHGVTARNCRSDGGSWRAYTAEPGAHAFVGCLGPVEGEGLVNWMEGANSLDPTPEDDTDDALFTKDTAASAVNTLSGERSTSFPGFKGAFSLKINTEEATGVLIGDVISVPVAGVRGFETGVVSADFGPYNGDAPQLERWTFEVAEGTLKVEANGTCPSEEEVAAALCGHFTSKSDKERVIETCVAGKDWQKLSSLAAQWERARFERKPELMLEAYTKLASPLESPVPTDMLQLAAWKLEVFAGSAGARATLEAALTKFETWKATGEDLPHSQGHDLPGYFSRAAEIAQAAGFDDLVTRATQAAE